MFDTFSTDFKANCEECGVDEQEFKDACKFDVCLWSGQGGGAEVQNLVGINVICYVIDGERISLCLCSGQKDKRRGKTILYR